MSRRWMNLSLLLVVALLTGCATVDIDQQLATSNQEAAAFTGGKASLARTDAQRQALKLTAPCCAAA